MLLWCAIIRGKPLALEVERQGSSLSLTLTPDTKSGGGKAEGFAGVVPKVIPLPDEYKTIRQYGPFSAIVEATDKTWQLMKLTVNMLGKLITGDVKLNNLSGPISIAQGGWDVSGVRGDLLSHVPCAD